LKKNADVGKKSADFTKKMYSFRKKKKRKGEFSFKILYLYYIYIYICKKTSIFKKFTFQRVIYEVIF